jgi:hypothetical protein
MPTAAKKFNLMEKVALASSAMLPPKKTAANPGFKGTKYATLADVINVIEPQLEEHKLAHLILFRGRNIVYRVWDLEGAEKIESELEMPMDGLSGNISQQVGGMITYFRRYVLVSFWNLIPEDDDGNSAPRRETPQRTAEEVIAAVQGGGSL